MKKIVYILGIICAMIMQSCLDLEPKTQLADTNYWKSPEHFKLFATQFYGWSADFRWLDDSQHADIRSDLFAGSTVNIYSNGTNSIPSSDKHYADNYNRIRQVNTLLQQADAYEQQADIAISVGEARFFRAYCYFELLQAYGDLICLIAVTIAHQCFQKYFTLRIYSKVLLPLQFRETIKPSG